MTFFGCLFSGRASVQRWLDSADLPGGHAVLHPQGRGQRQEGRRVWEWIGWDGWLCFRLDLRTGQSTTTTKSPSLCMPSGLYSSKGIQIPHIGYLQQSQFVVYQWFIARSTLCLFKPWKKREKILPFRKRSFYSIFSFQILTWNCLNSVDYSDKRYR